MIYDYSCLMLNIPLSISKKIFEWGKENISNDVLVVNDEAGGREDELHVTVKFGLVDKKPSDELLNILNSFNPFSVKIGKVSLFKNGAKKGFDVVKCEIISSSLRELNKLVTATCKNEDEYKNYNPHMTLAYVQPNSCNHLEGKNILSNDDNEFTVNEVRFHGAGAENENRVKQTIKLNDINYKKYYK